MKVIDFRVRPPTDEFKTCLKALADRVGFRWPDAWYNSNLESCVREIPVFARPSPTLRLAFPGVYCGVAERAIPER